MKKLILIFLLIACPALAQDGMILTFTDSVTLDSTDTEVLYFGFYSRSGGTHGFSSTAFAPKNSVHLTDHLLITGYIDSLTASHSKDSLTAKVEFLDKDGYVLGSEVLFFDFANNDTSATADYLSWSTPFNRAAATLGTTNPTFWIDLSGLMKAVHGLKITFDQVTTGSNFQSKVVVNLAQGLKSVR